MKIAHITIRNILGVAELEFSPSGFVEIAGPNGSGKTSVLEAIKAAIQGGHDATLLRKGAEKGEVVLVLDDGTQITRKVSPSNSTTEVKRDGKKVARPAEAIRALTDMLSVNPVDFLRAPKKDRVRVLLEAMPLEVDAEKLAAISGVTVQAPPGTHALQVIEHVYKTVYDERTGTNRAVREKEATINQLQQAMPDAPDGIDGSEDDLHAQIETATAARDDRLGQIAEKLDGIKADTAQAIADVQAKLREEIARLQAEAQAKIDAYKANLSENEAKAAKAREAAIAKHAATVQPLQSALAALRANRSAFAKREQALQTITQMEAEAQTLRADAQKQTEALDAIERYKSDLLASLPIPGLEVRDGEIYRDGVPFDRLNTAQQVDIAVEIAKLRAGDLGVICVDGIELLDASSYEAFRERAIASGLQLFVTRVRDEEFSINAEGQ